MEFTDVPDVRDGEEAAPDFEAWDDAETLLKDRPTRERLLDVVLQLRTPTKVATIAERADCNTETARDYLKWFAEMGMVRERSGRPVEYELNSSYLRWRRIERIREELDEAEIVAELEDTMEEIETYRERFDADSPDAVSLLDAANAGAVEERWDALSSWKTAIRRAELLDAARRTTSGTDTGSQHVDA